MRVRRQGASKLVYEYLSNSEENFLSLRFADHDMICNEWVPNQLTLYVIHCQLNKEIIAAKSMHAM